MSNLNVKLELLREDDREQFILDNQESFNYGALTEFGRRFDMMEEDEEIISRKTIEDSIDSGIAYRILVENKKVGGVVIKINGEEGDLELLFVKPEEHTKGIGYAAWCEIERLYPRVKKWQTLTPYFETRNIHFYVNRCGFHIVEFFNSFHKYHEDSATDGGNYNVLNDSDINEETNNLDGMFRFEKVMF